MASAVIPHPARSFKVQRGFTIVKFTFNILNQCNKFVPLMISTERTQVLAIAAMHFIDCNYDHDCIYITIETGAPITTI